MKTLRPFATVIAATVVVWIGFWFFSGQDLNLFARQVLPYPIIGTLVVSSILSGIINGVYRLAKRAWLPNFHRALWFCWIVTIVGFLTLLSTTSA